MNGTAGITPDSETSQTVQITTDEQGNSTYYLQSAQAVPTQAFVYCTTNPVPASGGNADTVYTSAGGTTFYATTTEGQTVAFSGTPTDISDVETRPMSVDDETSRGPDETQATSLRDMDIVHVRWLIDNYETAEGVSLPRSTLYNHYLRHCSENNLDPVNAASFGKLIRSVFLGLRTRRLGTRGNSKYHYYGIRVKPSSPLAGLPVEDSDSNPPPVIVRPKPVTVKRCLGISSDVSPDVKPKVDDMNEANLAEVSLAGSKGFLGDPSQALPSQLMMVLMSGEGEFIDEKEAYNFTLNYREYCESLLDVIVNLQFQKVSPLWQQFFITSPSTPEEEKKRDHLHRVLTSPSVVTFIRTTDTQFYHNLVHVLIPDVLRPVPAALTQAIRNFAKNVEQWMSSAMQKCPEEAKKLKLSLINSFAQTLRRYTSLNHLAQAARAVLQNSAQIQQMLLDLNKVDFRNVQDQASWVCECDPGLVRVLEQDFKRQLESQASLSDWARWLEQVVDKVLENTLDIVKSSRRFLLTWSFYSSMIIRDLTLRSASSFGSFHLIRLLSDEYMFYLVEQKVAQALEKVPISLNEDLSQGDISLFETGYEVVLPDGCDVKDVPG
ncbi:DNA-binding protein RFX2 [Galendromus occidentalis]|uniref:DNA-binding protein RFX2 n=1 Tax=Galendromus occidentalis TaxID=34638 RepID=A0AAJ7P926_9ACAR|nr:DNA-binding protein RFX2 [Galendromus occidentalis]